MPRVSPGRLARTYGQALFSACKPEDFDSVSSQLAKISRFFDDSPELFEALIAKTISSEQKRILVDVLGPRWGLSIEVGNLLRLLAEAGRFSLIGGIIRSFEDAVREYRHILSIEVIVARSLTDDEERLLRERLRAVVHSSIAITVRVDEEIIGGLLLRSGDSVFDSSLRTRLRRLEESLAAPV